MQPLSSATAASKRSQPSFFLKACMYIWVKIEKGLTP
jgi:hypothetical protein